MQKIREMEAALEQAEANLKILVSKQQATSDKIKEHQAYELMGVPHSKTELEQLIKEHNATNRDISEVKQFVAELKSAIEIYHKQILPKERATELCSRISKAHNSIATSHKEYNKALKNKDLDALISSSKSISAIDKECSLVRTIITRLRDNDTTELYIDDAELNYGIGYTIEDWNIPIKDNVLDLSIQEIDNKLQSYIANAVQKAELLAQETQTELTAFFKAYNGIIK